MVEVLIVTLIIGILMAIAIPNFFSARSNSSKSSCIANLKDIEVGKELWSAALQKTSSDTPSKTDLVGSTGNGYMKSFPICPLGGTYTIGNMATLPTCTKGTSDGHVAATS